MPVTPERPVAAIDIGTNSVLLTVARSNAAGAFEALVDRATITRLGQGVDRERRLQPAAVERTLACLRDYALELRRHGASALAVVGTSALRDAAGGESFLDEAERTLGVRPRVIAGDEEAALTYRGALSGLTLRGSVLVFDVGGGSTELIVGDQSAPTPGERVSLDIGSVRLFERFVRSDPPRADELNLVAEEIRRALADAPRPTPPFTLVGVAGTVTTLMALALGLTRYDGQRVHGAALTREVVDGLCRTLSAATLAERCKPGVLDQGRADVIVAGAAIVREVMAFANADTLVVSDRGVRYGLLEALLDPRG